MQETLTRAQILEKARAKRTLNKHRRWAQEMRDAGWKVEEPSEVR